MSLQASNHGHRQRASTLVSFEPDESGLRAPPERQRGVVGRDPRSMFGDLPNSSFDTDLLGDPVRRELDHQRGELTAEKKTHSYLLVHMYDTRTTVLYTQPTAFVRIRRTRTVLRQQFSCGRRPSTYDSNAALLIRTAVSYSSSSPKMCVRANRYCCCRFCFSLLLSIQLCPTPSDQVLRRQGRAKTHHRHSALGSAVTTTSFGEESVAVFRSSWKLSRKNETGEF